MSNGGRLSGSCSCGRYNYVIHVPGDTNARRAAQVHFGTSNLDRRSQASLLSAWLRVPLAWYQSATVAFFPDERHDLIARTFIPQRQAGCQRKFCGFCGTHISYWTEEPPSEQDFMNITLGSLTDRDILALEELDLLPEDVDVKELAQKTANDETKSPPRAEKALASPAVNDDVVAQTSRSGTTNGISWFEDMIQGSQLGYHSKKRRGQGVSADGTTTLQWEVSEYFEDTEEPESATFGSKRKAADIATDDAPMKH